LQNIYTLCDQPGTKFTKRGRAKGGIICGWRKCLDSYVSYNILDEGVIGLTFIRSAFKCYFWFLYFGPGTAYDSQWTEFFQSIASDQTPVVIARDLNSRVGENSVGSKDRCSRDLKVNKRGRKLVALLNEMGFEIGNGCTPGDEDGSFTFVHRNGRDCSVNDLLIFRNIRVESLEVLPLSHSDHFPICFEVPIKLKKLSKATSYRWMYRILNEDQALIFNSEIQDHLSNITTFDEELETNYSILKSAIEIAGRNAIILKEVPIRPYNRINNAFWFDEECKISKKSKNASLRSWKSDPTDLKLQQYIQDRKTYIVAKKTRKQEYQETVEFFLYYHGDGKEFSKCPNMFRKKTRANSISIPKETWENHFRNIFQSEDEIFPTEIENSNLEEVDETKESEFSDEEVITQLKMLKNGKAPVLDNIPNEMYKIGGPVVHEKHRNFQQMLYIRKSTTRMVQFNNMSDR